MKNKWVKHGVKRQENTLVQLVVLFLEEVQARLTKNLVILLQDGVRMVTVSLCKHGKAKIMQRKKGF